MLRYFDILAAVIISIPLFFHQFFQGFHFGVAVRIPISHADSFAKNSQSIFMVAWQDENKLRPETTTLFPCQLPLVREKHTSFFGTTHDVVIAANSGVFCKHILYNQVIRFAYWVIYVPGLFVPQTNTIRQAFCDPVIKRSVCQLLFGCIPLW